MNDCAFVSPLFKDKRAWAPSSSSFSSEDNDENVCEEILMIDAESRASSFTTCSNRYRVCPEHSLSAQQVSTGLISSIAVSSVGGGTWQGSSEMRYWNSVETIYDWWHSGSFVPVWPQIVGASTGLLEYDSLPLRLTGGELGQLTDSTIPVVYGPIPITVKSAIGHAVSAPGNVGSFDFDRLKDRFKAQLQSAEAKSGKAIRAWRELSQLASETESEDGFEDGFTLGLKREIYEQGASILRQFEILASRKSISLSTQIEALKVFGRVDDVKTRAQRLQILMRLLSSSEPAIRDASTVGLGYLEDVGALVALHQAASREIDKDIRDNMIAVARDLSEVAKENAAIAAKDYA